MANGVEFDEDSFSFNKPTSQSSSPSSMPNFASSYSTSSYSPNIANEPKMVQWLMRHGIKSPNAANVILLIVVGLNIAITIAVFKFLV